MVKGLRPASRSHSPAPIVPRPINSTTTARPTLANRGQTRGTTITIVVATNPALNKVATTVQVRFDVLASKGIPVDVKKRLRSLAGKRITEDGILIIKAGRFRKQEQNRQDGVERLVRLIKAAAVKPKKRIKTRPSKAARERKLADKKHRGQVKKMRKKVSNTQE